MANEHQQQPYDSSLKALVQEQPEELVPLFLPGAQYEQTYNVEITGPTRRADKVYRIQFNNRPHILHLEFESGSDSGMDVRLLVYHVGIFEEYRLPVISMVIYLFRTSMVESPFREESGQEELLTFHFRTLPLWKLNAEQYVQQHAVSMYTLLPTMQGANAELLSQAIQEMAEHYKDDESKLARHLV